MKLPKHKKNSRQSFFRDKHISYEPYKIEHNRVRYRLSSPSHGDKEMSKQETTT